MPTPEAVSKGKLQVSSETERLYVELMELYPYVRNVVRKSIGDVPHWEDVVQEIFASCLSSLERGKFDGGSSLRTWVHRITMRRVYDSLRQGYRSFPVPVLTTYSQMGELPSPEWAFEQKETREKIESGFFVLSSKERQVFIFLLNGWESWEIGHSMKASTRRINELRVSGLRKLRKLYGVQNGRQNNSRSRRFGY